MDCPVQTADRGKKPLQMNNLQGLSFFGVRIRVRINTVSHSLRGQTGSYMDFLNFLDAEPE